MKYLVVQSMKFFVLKRNFPSTLIATEGVQSPAKVRKSIFYGDTLFCDNKGKRRGGCCRVNVVKSVAHY